VRKSLEGGEGKSRGNGKVGLYQKGKASSGREQDRVGGLRRSGENLENSAREKEETVWTKPAPIDDARGASRRSPNLDHREISPAR